MENKSENGCGDGNLEHANPKTEGDDDCHSSTNENNSSLVKCLEQSLKRAQLMLQAQGKKDKLDSWTVETAKTNIDYYCGQLVEEAVKKNGSDNQYDIIDQRLTNDLMQDKDINLLSNTISEIINLLKKEPDRAPYGIEHANLMPRFYQLLNWNEQPDIQCDVIRIIKLLCSDYTPLERRRISILRLVNLLELGYNKVAMKALSVLCKKVALGGESCDLVLASGFVSTLLVQVKPENDGGYPAKIFAIVSKIFHTWSPEPDIMVIAQLMPLLSFFIDLHKYIGLLPIINTITSITREGSTYCQLVIDSCVLNKIIPLVCHKDRRSRYTSEVFDVLERIATGSKARKMALLDAGVMVMLRFAFFNGDEILFSSALPFLKNFIGDDCELLQVVVDSDLFPKILTSISYGSLKILHREAALTLTSFFRVGGQKQLNEMAKKGAVVFLIELLSSGDFVPMVLEAIQSYVEILDNEKDRNNFFLDLEYVVGYESIKSLHEESGKLRQILFGLYCRGAVKAIT